MPAQVDSATILGIDAFTVQVEVDCAPGMDKYFIVGLPDTAVREAQERVRSALRNSQFRFPPNSRVVVNLAPSDIRQAHR